MKLAMNNNDIVLQNKTVPGLDYYMWQTIMINIENDLMTAKIARILKTTHKHVSLLIAKLESEELITTKKKGRYKLITLTPKGIRAKDLLKQLTQIVKVK